MDSRLLEYFLRVTELGSINRAAMDMNLSQPALSRYIASLEHELKCSLFARSRGGVTLTEAGQLLADRARPLLRQFTVLKQQVGEHAAGQLSVGVPPSWERVFTLPFAQKLSTTHPHVGLRLHEGVSNVLRDYMHAGLLDFCIVPFGEAQTQGYRQTRLVREQLLLVRKKDAGLRLDEPVALSSLDGLKLVLPSRPNALRVQVEHALERKGMTYAGGIETDTLALCLELTRLGLGVTVMPACTLYEYPHAEQFSWAPIRGQYLTWALYENLARTHSQAVREGRKMILSIVSEATDKKNWFSAQRV